MIGSLLFIKAVTGFAESSVFEETKIDFTLMFLFITMLDVNPIQQLKTPRLKTNLVQLSNILNKLV